MTTNPRNSPASLTTAHFGAGLSFLLLSLTACLVLAAGHLNVMEAPGCGGGSPCDRAAASVFGKLPLVGWPLSLFGLAWFSGLLAAWTAAFLGSGTSAPFRNLVRLGAAGSLVYVTAMIVGGYLCPYCIAVHIGGIGFLFVSEKTRACHGRTLVLAGWGLAVFAIVTGIEVRVNSAAVDRTETRLAESTRAMIDASRDGSANAFTSRHRIGADPAAIRIVIFSDYSCPHCQIVEAQARAILAERDDVSLTAKHYPMCTDCNRHTSSNLHETACDSAAAAEAVAQLYGEDAFWEVHSRLFEQGHHFDDQKLREYLTRAGHDTSEFDATRKSEAIRALVEQDVEEAHSLGISQTPTIYINGVELKGVAVPGALSRAVEDLAATNPPALAAESDRPPSAKEKYISDWKATPYFSMESEHQTRSLGPEDAPVEIVMWGDYLTDLTAQADAAILKVLDARDDVRYTYRHFPLHSGCNPISEVIIEENSCLAHQAAEAAATLEGNDGYWRMHEWLLANREGFDLETLTAGAEDLGFGSDALLTIIEQAEPRAAIAVDCGLARQAGTYYVPGIMINGRRVKSWSQEGILEILAEEAAAEFARGESPSQVPADSAQRAGVPVQIEVPEGAFTGRFRLGPRRAALRIVMFTDYESESCKQAAQEARTLAKSRSDVSFSPKQFPLNSTCNPYASDTLHANTCVAAQVMEAFGMAYGNEAFWELDRWMYESAPKLDLNGVLQHIEDTRRLREPFSAALRDPESLARVKRDIEEGHELGLQELPLVYLNGSLIADAGVPGNLTRAVEALAATRPEPGDATQDQPE